MQAILERERLRCDRGGAQLALLTLTFPQPCDAQELNLLGKLLRDRIRATDDAGLMGSRCVGVVLPDTHPEGAWKLAEDLCALMPGHVARPQCDVYSYPTHPVNGEPVADLPGGTRAHNGKHSGGRLEPAATNGKAAGNGHHARPMEVLFIRPLPAWKRAVDVAGAGVAIVLAAPVMLLAAATIKLTSRGPVVFRQKRDTIGGRHFTLYKFRTMSIDAEARKAGLMALNEQDGPAFKIANDPRVTRIGRFLRVTSIDELPQLFNVLKGDMTLVGPRALPSNESRRCEAWHRRRLDVTAGMTCIWQVRGRSSVSFAEWMRMDLSYIRSRSLVNDVKLLAQTVPAVLLRRGAC
jgi:lipopolysaccharide/colanic/teichoic acid biosynthesis glycosyltransferase